ncbi:hypothetical protein BFG52_12090 [Acinetobacter larvae]|uniref:Lipoprotein n=1 Tax=Acinetobacter larvae TaxID=1789224 RepID=A0A1B2M1E3_9GAMM|nr:hypothetical protein BFG52_12090 [Acinetobacter larvae]
MLRKAIITLHLNFIGALSCNAYGISVKSHDTKLPQKSMKINERLGHSFMRWCFFTAKILYSALFYI